MISVILGWCLSCFGGQTIMALSKPGEWSLPGSKPFSGFPALSLKPSLRTFSAIQSTWPSCAGCMLKHDLLQCQWAAPFAGYFTHLWLSVPEHLHVVGMLLISVAVSAPPYLNNPNGCTVLGCTKHSAALHGCMDLLGFSF